MKIVKKNTLLFILFFLIGANLFSQTIQPYLYWTFDSPNPYEDVVKKQRVNTSSYSCVSKIIEGGVGNGVDEGVGNPYSLFVTGALKNNVTKEFSIEFLSSGNQFLFITFSDQIFNISLQYAYISFTTAVSNGSAIVSDILTVQLNGSNKESYNYYTDGKWHHFVFTGSTITGKKEVWVDGELLESGSKNIPVGGNFAFGASDAFKSANKLDELAFYNKVLPAQLIRQHYLESQGKRHYTFNSKQISSKAIVPQSPLQKSLDPKEFAPGYPTYSIQALDQLKQFPLPRYNSSIKSRRNFSWMDITYLHREYPNDGTKVFPPVNPQKAVEMTDELVKKWNYYLEVPCFRSDSTSSNKQYSNSSSIYGALINYANEHPQYPVSTITFQAQITPAHAGFNDSRNFENSQNLPDKYYLCDATGKPVKSGNKKWLSPLAPLDIIQKDGQTSQFYLRQLLKYLKNIPAVINENGELFGHMRSDALLKSDPNVKKQMEAIRMNNAQYSGWFQYRLDSTYKAEILKLPTLKNTNYSLYNVSAFNSEYWPDYAQRRKINLWDKKYILSTPDFYPRTPGNWSNKSGPWNGYGEVAKGRQKEIELGDKFFSPFVAAGWGNEEQNIRPAQWLALLKSMVMLGADFFYVGYFNVTGAGGKWPNGVGPNDPRGYIYQAAMPAYAQAIATLVPDFFEKGTLLNPNIAPDKQFRFAGSRANELILARKLNNNKYLLYGSIQANSNIAGNVPQSVITTIDLEGKKLSFEVRRQGSIYVLDLAGSSPVFYQLDAWHQYEHPYYWSKDIEVEAELFNSNSSKKLITTHTGSEFDFSRFTTTIVLEKNVTLTYEMPVRNTKTFDVVLNAKGNGTIKVQAGNFTKSVSVNSQGLKDLTAGSISGISEGQLNMKLISVSGNVQIDKILLRAKN